MPGIPNFHAAIPEPGCPEVTLKFLLPQHWNELQVTLQAHNMRAALLDYERQLKANLDSDVPATWEEALRMLRKAVEDQELDFVLN